MASSAVLLTGCKEWKPRAGAVRPELLLEGPTRVEIVLDNSERYVLVSRFHTDDEGNETRRFNVVDWKNRTSCELPKETVRYESPLLGPSDERKQSPLFLLPLVVRSGDAQVLAFFDQRCRQRGETDYGLVSTTIVRFAQDEDGRETLLYGNGTGTLALADPWRDERTEITTGIRALSFVQRASALSAPQLLWLIEDGKLTQRTLDGTLLLSLGEHVTEFSQVLLTQLRVAYVDNGNLFEATGPDFEPTEVAPGACRPVYRGSFLELFNPCADSQLVRINLMTGMPTEFDPGVFESYSQGGLTFETKRDADGILHQWVEAIGRAKVEIVPRFIDSPQVLDAATVRLAGLKELPSDGEGTRRALMMWSPELGDVEVFEGSGNIDGLYSLPDYRSSSYWWLVYHDRLMPQDVDMHELGKLSVISVSDMSIETFAENVPLASPIQRSPSVRGFSLESLPAFTKEAAIAYIDQASALERDPRLSRGTLHVQLISGELGSTLATDVTSYRLVMTPLPGVLYGIEEGEQPGLWFAAL